MKIINYFITGLYSSYYKKLQKVDSDKLEKLSEKKAINAFKFASKTFSFSLQEQP